MNTELKQLIANADWAAVELARASGPKVVVDIEPHLQNPDPAVRALAVECLGAAGGPAAPELMIRMLRDANEQVRINAVNGLHARPPLGRENELLAVWDADRSRDAWVRQQIPMILGRTGSQGAVPDLRRRLHTEERADVRDGLVAGLAKLGEPQARADFGALLRDARRERTAEVMELVRYEEEPWVIPQLVPVLQRREIAVNLSSHRVQLRRRECDLAVDAVLRISKAQFSFRLNESANYTDAQIDEALRYARALGGEQRR